MTETRHSKDDIPEKRPADAGAIIDASGHRRPRIHRPEADYRTGAAGFDFLTDVPLKVNVVLAETTMPLGEILALEVSSVVQLDKLSGEPLDIYVEDQKLGKGEVIVLQEKLRIRVLEVTPPSSGTGALATRRPEEG
ncbi:MAG: FliM/FliN family flagellar motor switch protein [Candidatus Hydrogenedentota bacterium]|nr:MAG: FliM/FliN family flagellar motor switch protein [Candidatus Hydrogenedentota bacterium]